jgi:hypothetical protein
MYSLLATSINETIATLFDLRARMLKTAIITGMLSDTSKDDRWTSSVKGVRGFFKEILRIILGNLIKEKEIKKIGHKFFDNPVIKNYGSSRIFPLPSYIPTKNFSTVLIEELKKEFDFRLHEIAQNKFKNQTSTAVTIASITQDLQNSSDSFKLAELFKLYKNSYINGISTLSIPIIDSETCMILEMHLRESVYDIVKFSEKIENWFDDSMNRVGGWYKRQAQTIVFLIGLLLAITFNVDIIQIAGKLSVDKDARDKLVQSSIQAVDKYKDDPRVKKTTLKDGTFIYDTTITGIQNNDSIFKSYNKKIATVNKMLKNEIDSTNDILAVGWGDYGKKRDGEKVLLKYRKPGCCRKKIITESELVDSKSRQHVLDSIYDKHWIKYKVGYIVKESAHGKKLLGYLILAFAVSIGAPFWFDLLSKLIKIRGSGKKEGDGNPATSSTTAAAQLPVNITVNTSSQSGEEAVG